ncbi:hypothetical protein [Ectopseudomonas toyotomiensis]|uniref:hypothetical protein n=1 Tax=Ectopseudomonas toyotomiensis TaxID=554344 RepID=UPI003D107C56
MENSTFLKQLTLPVVVAFALLNFLILSGLLAYSAYKDVTFRIWGKEFGAVTNTSSNRDLAENSKFENLDKKIKALEQRLSNFEKKISSIETSSNPTTTIKPINKTRILDVGQQWNEPELSLSLQFTGISGFEESASFEIAIKTPESPPYRTKIHKGWHRSFTSGSREIAIKIIDTNLESGTVTISLNELGA